MWKRKLLLLVVGLGGLAALGGALLQDDAPRSPRSFAPGRAATGELADLVSQIDGELRQHWAEAGLEPAPRAPDRAILRRLSLGLTGTVPSLEELRTVERLPSDQRVEWWVSHLLEDRRYGDYVGERLARAYVGTDFGPPFLFRRRRFVLWLSDRLMENQAYDELVRTLITDTGLWTDSPAVNFITATLDGNNDSSPDPEKLAARTTRAFLGVRLDCVQCHDDHLDFVWKQSDFHQLAAFFAPAQRTFTGIADDESRAYRYQYLHADEAAAVPARPPFAPELFVAEGRRREQLARWVTHPENLPFARAAVNRVWALMFGRPLVEPIDNIPLTGPYPPPLETLARDFAAHRFDVQRLIRAIAASEAFQLDSRGAPGQAITEAHEDHWAAFPLTRLRPEQVAGALLQAASLTTIDAQSHIVVKLTRYGQQDEFLQRYGDMGEDEFTDRGGTIPQRLVMLNGKLVHERTEPNPLMNAATRIAMLAPDDDKAIETAYLAVLTRGPAADEAAHFRRRLGESANRQQALQDLVYVLLNSSEFSWNH